MKKILGLFVLILALGMVPLAGLASDIPDGADCEAGGNNGVVTVANGAGEADRGAACVQGVFYIGGEAQAEEEGDPAAGGACGAILVGGTAVAGDADWDNDNGTPSDPSDDNHCD